MAIDENNVKLYALSSLENLVKNEKSDREEFGTNEIDASGEKTRSSIAADNGIERDQAAALDNSDENTTEATRLLEHQPQAPPYSVQYRRFSNSFQQYQGEFSATSTDIDVEDLQQLGEAEWYQEIVGSKPTRLAKDLKGRQTATTMAEQLRAAASQHQHAAAKHQPGRFQQLTGGLKPQCFIPQTTSSTAQSESFQQSQNQSTATSSGNQTGAQTSAESFEISSVAEPEQEQSLGRYLLELVTHVTKSDTIRGTQSRLTMWELLEHFDFLNDLFFICRVGMLTEESRVMENPFLQRLGSISIVYLICIWLLSAVAYGVRGFIIYHRIAPEHQSIFYPFYVFAKIRDVGEPSPSTLYMYERLSWTYQLIMRIFEDIPQLLVSATFLANFGQNFYTYFMIAYSCTLMVITSVRMSVTYPLFRTLSLILSRDPPVDSPTLMEAAPTTRNFALFVSVNFALWCVTNALCLCFARGIAWWVLLFLSLFSGALAVFFAIYWFYLHRQGQLSHSMSLILDEDAELLHLSSRFPHQ